MPKILIIDDEEDIRDALQVILNRAGFETRAADTGKTGLAILQEFPADLALVDIIMPGMNGVDTITAIRHDYPGMRTVAMSGGGNIVPRDYDAGAISTGAYLASAEKAGADVTLPKPFQSDLLIETVRGLLADTSAS